MKTMRPLTRLFPAALFLVALSALVSGQPPPLPTLPRLEALNLEFVDGDVPAHYSSRVGGDVASNLAKRIASCRDMQAAASRPPLVLALLDQADWSRSTPLPYGMPHMSAVERPYVIVIPRSWDGVDPMLAGVRAHLAKALGQDVDRYVHQIALHELGHLLTLDALGTTAEGFDKRVPFWYGEFIANYFFDACLAPHAEESALVRRGVAALTAIPRQKFTMLDDGDRLMTEMMPAGPPYIMTEPGGLNFAWYQALTSQMASRLREAGLTTTRLIELLRQQWARPGRLETDVLLRDFEGISPGWREWLVEQGAIAPR